MNDERTPIVFVVALLKILSTPVILYGVFFVLRLSGLQPEAESGLGDFMTGVYFIFGASVAYFIFAMDILDGKRSGSVPRIWWWLSSTLLLFLCFDEIYMIHENIGNVVGGGELLVFFFYGTVLCLLLIWNRQALTVGFYVCFSGFVVLSGIAVTADHLFGEGLVVIFSKEIDYEQLAESLSALALSAGFVVLARQHVYARYSLRK